MISRPQLVRDIETALRRNRITVLVGPRQCGKTTLARLFVPSDSLNYFDLEDPVSLARLDEPMTALQDLRGTVVIDEIQRRPNLFPTLRVLADRSPLPAKFLILGSATPELLRQSAESLAGRMEVVSMSGLSLDEVGDEARGKHWLRGGFPPSFLADSDEDSFAWRRSFLLSLLERDLPAWGIGVVTPMLRRFWAMLAHYHGQTWNGSEPARALGVSQTTTRRYLDLLTSVFMMRQLQPWHENLKKRQVRSPKVYFRDSGLLHQLLGIRSERDLLLHPKCGASWEGYAVETVISAVRPDEAYFWATHNGAELDLLLFTSGRRLGVECKRADAPRLTLSMRTALEDLKLDRLVVVYPGDQTYPLAERVTVVPLTTVAQGELGNPA